MEHNRVQRSSVAALLAASSLLAAPPLVVGADAQQSAARSLEATLRGTTYGDPNGRGHADFRLFPRRQRVCVSVTYRRIDEPIQAHIHRGRAGVDGDVVIDLSGSVVDGTDCAREVPRRLIRRILDHPRRYYFNVHTEVYPAGAIRGQLHR